jgi:sugar diacid utilization regulator
MGGSLIMFKKKTIQEQLVEERRKNEALLSELIRVNANLEYVAMMTDVDINDEPTTERIGDDNE